jgi:hypothetical protein
MNTSYSSRVQAPNSSLDSSSPNDSVSLNCMQQDTVDDRTVGRRSRNYQKIQKIYKKISRPFFISTYNVRSLNEGWKQHELVAKAFEFDIPVIALQEHRIKNKPTLIIDGYKFLLSPPKDRRILGVGFLLSPWAQRCYIEHKIISDRIMYVSFTGHVRINVITCHAPHNASTDTEMEEFYNELSSCVQSFCPHEIIFIARDHNAHLSSDICNKNVFYSTTNRNGQLLVDFAQENSLSIASLKFNKKKSKNSLGLLLTASFTKTTTSSFPLSGKTRYRTVSRI